ncbi:MAG: hypothetical protein IPK74_29335 [Deltaproteobacteria bacterium]|nr:hypothetical protein [Deltaproteobacteria bacterium]
MHPHDKLLPLFVPFVSRINPAVDEADARSVEWALVAGLVNPVGVARLRAARFAWLSSRAYPTAPVEGLVLVSRWNLWLFAHDDACDAAAIGRDPAAMSRLYARLVPVLRGGPVDAADPPLAVALHDLVAGIFAVARPAWQARFAAAVETYFEGCLWEARNRAARRTPGLQEYIHMRRAAGAVQTAIELIEVCEELVLDDEMLDHLDVSALAVMCNDVVCWTNDLASLPKEIAEGNVHNLVVVLQHERCRGNWAHAVALAQQQLDARVREFIALADNLPCFGAPRDAELARYVENLRAWMRGNLDWAMESGRYRMAGAGELPADPGAPAAAPQPG